MSRSLAAVLLTPFRRRSGSGIGLRSGRRSPGSGGRGRSLGALVLAGLVTAQAGPAPGLAERRAFAAVAGGGQFSQTEPPTQDSRQCRLETPYWTTLSDLWLLPATVIAVTVEGWFVLEPGTNRVDRFFLEDDRDLGGKVELLPYPDWGGSFRDLARSLMGSRLEVTGCVERESRGREWNEAGILNFYRYLEIPQTDADRPPRDVELVSLRDGAFDGQRVRLRGVLHGRLHGALPLSTRLSESDWVLASGNAAAWMRGRAPEGDGFSLDPDDADDHGWGLAVVGVVAWWRGAPSLHVESAVLSGPRPPSPVVVLFTLPLDRRLDATKQRIEVGFNTPMDETSFDGRVELIDAGGDPVPAHLEYDDTLWRLSVSPLTAVGAGEDLLLRLRTGIRSAEGIGVRPDAEAGEGLVLTRSFRVP